MPPAEFEPTISAGEQPQTYALDRAATGTGNNDSYYNNNNNNNNILQVHVMISYQILSNAREKLKH